MSTILSDFQYWPFSISDADKSTPELIEKIAFLDNAKHAGFDAYRFGINNFGAKSLHRTGIVLERGRNRWEIRLSQNENRRMSAFTEHFPAAATAVTEWLAGRSIAEILEKIKNNLAVPPGLKASYEVVETTSET